MMDNTAKAGLKPRGGSRRAGIRLGHLFLILASLLSVFPVYLMISERKFQKRGCSRKQLVARGVPLGIVHSLKTVQIGINHPHRFRKALLVRKQSVDTVFH